MHYISLNYTKYYIINNKTMLKNKENKEIVYIQLIKFNTFIKQILLI